MAEAEIDENLLLVSSESIPWPGVASLDFYGVNSAKANTGNAACRCPRALTTGVLCAPFWNRRTDWNDS